MIELVNLTLATAEQRGNAGDTYRAVRDALASARDNPNPHADVSPPTISPKRREASTPPVGATTGQAVTTLARRMAADSLLTRLHAGHTPNARACAKRKGAFIVNARMVNHMSVPPTERLRLPSLEQLGATMSLMRHLQLRPYFRKLDISNIFYTCRPPQGSDSGICVQIGDDVYGFLGLPFGWAHIPSLVQELRDLSVQHPHELITIMYLDDVLVFSRDCEYDVSWPLTFSSWKVNQPGVPSHPQQSDSRSPTLRQHMTARSPANSKRSHAQWPRAEPRVFRSRAVVQTRGGAFGAAMRSIALTAIQWVSDMVGRRRPFLHYRTPGTTLCAAPPPHCRSASCRRRHCSACSSGRSSGRPRNVAASSCL